MTVFDQTFFGALADPDFAPSGQAFRAVVTKTVAAPTDLVQVQLVNDGGNVTQPLAYWPARADGSLPERGDGCLVLLDDEGRPWVAVWSAQFAPPSPDEGQGVQDRAWTWDDLPVS